MSTPLQRRQTNARLSQVAIARGVVHVAAHAPTRARVQALPMKPGPDVAVAVAARA